MPATAQRIWERLGLPGAVDRPASPERHAVGRLSRGPRRHQGRAAVPADQDVRRMPHPSSAPVHGWFDTHCHLYDERLGSARHGDRRGSRRRRDDDDRRRLRPGDVDRRARHRSQPRRCLCHGRAASARGAPRRRHGRRPHRPDTVAIGECGLDYYYDHSPRDAQREAFAAQIALANEAGLTLVVHTRDAWDDTFDVLDAMRRSAAARLPLLHRRSRRSAGRPSTAGPTSASPASSRSRAPTTFARAATACPDDRLLIETDSPYLAPVPASRQAQPPGVRAGRRCLPRRAARRTARELLFDDGGGVTDSVPGTG